MLSKLYKDGSLIFFVIFDENEETEFFYFFQYFPIEVEVLHSQNSCLEVLQIRAQNELTFIFISIFMNQ